MLRAWPIRIKNYFAASLTALINDNTQKIWPLSSRGVGGKALVDGPLKKYLVLMNYIEIF